MFCSNCGEKLIDEDQNYCHKCGTEIFPTAKAPDYKPERLQAVSPQKIYYVPIDQQRQRQKGLPGKYSKLCLGLALISIFIGFGTLIFGYNYFRYIYYPYYNRARIAVPIGILLLRVAGLILGIFSKLNGSKAEGIEPYNDVEKAGSILAIFGIIINAVGLFLSLVGPSSIFPLPVM
jgi:DNA-directed RNA polymerase subunit RPC12/RpoP